MLSEEVNKVDSPESDHDKDIENENEDEDEKQEDEKNNNNNNIQRYEYSFMASDWKASSEQTQLNNEQLDLASQLESISMIHSSLKPKQPKKKISMSETLRLYQQGKEDKTSIPSSSSDITSDMLSGKVKETLSSLKTEEMIAIDQVKSVLDKKKSKAIEMNKSSSSSSKKKSNQVASLLASLSAKTEAINRQPLSNSSISAWDELLNDESSQKNKVKQVYDHKREIAEKSTRQKRIES